MAFRKTLSFYLAAILVGLLTGTLGAFFQICINALGTLIFALQIKFTKLGIPNWITITSITISMVLIASYLVTNISPSAAGSGVQEIEATLMHKRPLFWKRVLPVKFFGGILAIASNMVLGREGPTIQIGGSIGEAVSNAMHYNQKNNDALVAAGAAAGLATAFNAPLAGVLFVMEEMRELFSLSFVQFKTVALSCVTATIALQLIMGNNPAIKMVVFSTPKLSSLNLFFILGIVIGLVGIAFNVFLMRTLVWMDKQTKEKRLILIVSIAFSVGLLTCFWPDLVGGGYHIIEHSLLLSPGFKLLILFFLIRFILTMLCYGTGIPGGIFAPMLALGSLIGLAFATLFNYFIFAPNFIEPGMFAIVGMGALFSASVRAPVTGIILLVEMTQNYELILPLMVSCLTATTIVQLAGVEPIYTQLLQRTLTKRVSN